MRAIPPDSMFGGVLYAEQVSYNPAGMGGLVRLRAGFGEGADTATASIAVGGLARTCAGLVAPRSGLVQLHFTPTPTPPHAVGRHGSLGRRSRLPGGSESRGLRGGTRPAGRYFAARVELKTALLEWAEALDVREQSRLAHPRSATGSSHSRRSNDLEYAVAGTVEADYAKITAQHRTPVLKGEARQSVHGRREIQQRYCDFAEKQLGMVFWARQASRRRCVLWRGFTRYSPRTGRV